LLQYSITRGAISGLHAGPDVADDVGDQVLPVGVAHHVAIQRAGLDEVVVVAVLVVASQLVLASQDKPDEPIPRSPSAPQAASHKGSKALTAGVRWPVLVDPINVRVDSVPGSGAG